MAAAGRSSAIVLAGGRSSRFGAQKLAVDLDGAPLLHHAVRAVAAVCDEVLVIGAPSGLPVDVPGDLALDPVVVLDVDAYEGPLVALTLAARSASNGRLLLVGGDMPNLEAGILRRLLDWGDGSQGACLVVDSWSQPFPMGLDRDATVRQGGELVSAGDRSLRDLMAVLDLELIAEDDWRALDPDAHSLRDIDRPSDLEPIA